MSNNNVVILLCVRIRFIFSRSARERAQQHDPWLIAETSRTRSARVITLSVHPMRVQCTHGDAPTHAVPGRTSARVQQHRSRINTY